MIDFHHDVRLDQSETLFFKLPLDDPKVEWLVPDAMLRWRSNRFTISQVETERTPDGAYVSIEADALWYRLGETAYPGTTLIESQTPTDALGNTILIATGWGVGADSTTDTDTFSLEVDDASALKMLREWAKVTGKFVKFDTMNMTVSLVDDRGQDQGTPFRYGRNLTRIKKRENPPRVTRLYPYGRDDLNISGVNGGLEYLDDFSWYTDRGLTLPEAEALYTKKAVLFDDSFQAEAALLAYAQEQIEEMARGTTVYEAEVVDLLDEANQGELLDFDVGDTARVADTAAGIDVVTTVVRIDRYPQEPWRNRIELDSLPKVPGQGSASGRPSSALQWQQAGSDSSQRQLTNGGSQIVNRIGLRFREGGEAHFGYDLTFTGVGTGSASVSAMDAESDTLLHPVLSIPYTDGQVVHEVMTWWMEELTGQYDFRIRMIAVSDPFAPSGGIHIAAAESKFWIMYHSAVRQTPTLPNSVVYDFTGAIQTFEVPDDVTEVTIECKGGEGGGANGDFPAGLGGRAVARFPVIPGTTYDVYVGGLGHGETPSPDTTWPNGGRGGDSGSSSGCGGGGSSDVRPQGGTMADALLCAAGGGGVGDRGGSIDGGPGGDGGFFAGLPGYDQNLLYPVGGATQFSGGIAYAAFGGGDGGFDAGGVGEDSANAFRFPGGGGGGGYYGGAGGFEDSVGGGEGIHANSAGGGGSGWISPSGYDLEIEDGSNTGDGQITISWETPE